MTAQDWPPTVPPNRERREGDTTDHKADRIYAGAMLRLDAETKAHRAAWWTGFWFGVSVVSLPLIVFFAWLRHMGGCWGWS